MSPVPPPVHPQLSPARRSFATSPARYLRRLGAYLVGWVLVAAAAGFVVVVKDAPVVFLAVVAALAVGHTIALMLTWPVAVTLRPEDVRVRRLIGRRRFGYASIAASVHSDRLSNPLYQRFSLLALGAASGRSLLRVDDRLLTPADLAELTAAVRAIPGPRHSVDVDATDVDELVRTHPYAGTILNRHPYATRIIGFVAALITVVAIIAATV